MKEIINKIHELADKIGLEKKEIEEILNQMQETVKRNREESEHSQEA